MTIQWFPGHMTRARRQIQDKLKLIDLVIELLDARLPSSSRNPMIDEILQNKPRIVLLNKYDMADPIVTSDWLDFFRERGLQAIPIDAASGYRVKDIVPQAKQLLADKFAAQIRKGINPRAIRALIVGIPNVGKSTLINRLAGRKVAATGDRPGITKGQQWIKMGDEMELLDTPGILWPKFEDQEVGIRLAATGAIKEKLLHAQDIAYYVIRYLIMHYPTLLIERYELDSLPNLSLVAPPQTDPDALSESEAIVAVMEQIGRKRGSLQSGGKVDLEKASLLILRDLQTGRIGKISMERPS